MWPPVVFHRSDETQTARTAMNRIEKVFGLSPDGGSGATELLLAVAAGAALAIAVTGVGRLIRNRSTR
jgi:hypothetical protein